MLSKSSFLAALAALYLTLVTHWVSQCHFWILTQRVSFETWHPSDIWSAWCPDKRQKDKKTKKLKDKKDKKTKRQKGKKTKQQKYEKTKDKRQRSKREFNIVTSGQFRTLAMFYWFLDPLITKNYSPGPFWCKYWGHNFKSCIVWSNKPKSENIQNLCYQTRQTRPDQTMYLS